MSDKKMLRDDLGNRMKTFYEQIPKTKLMRRCPVIYRVDGKSFHNFTKKFERPFDEVLIKTMQETAKFLCENIQGCVLGYCQSDEISLLLIDYQRFETSAWFDYEVQKMCSIAASMEQSEIYYGETNQRSLTINIQIGKDESASDIMQLLSEIIDKTNDKGYGVMNAIVDGMDIFNYKGFSKEFFNPKELLKEVNK